MEIVEKVKNNVPETIKMMNLDLPSVFTKSTIAKCVTNITHVKARYYGHIRLAQCAQWMVTVKCEYKISTNTNQIKTIFLHFFQ